MSNTNPYITKLKSINLLNGLLTGEITFQNGLNIVSGENGTGKTKLLQLIKEGTKEYANGNYFVLIRMNTDIPNQLQHMQKILDFAFRDRLQ